MNKSDIKEAINIEDNAFLSIIIPCYNMQEYIQECIDSLKSLRNADDVEFIFVNDGSIDNTLKIIREFEQEDSRVVVIDQENRGVSAARNKALDVFKGEYLLCLDSDDYLSPDTLDIIHSTIGDADLLIPNITKVYIGHKEILQHGIQPGGYTIDDFWGRCKIFPTIPKIIYKGEIIRNHNIRFNERVKCGEVFDFTVSIMEHSSMIIVSNLSFYNYRMEREGKATIMPNFESDISVLYGLEHYFNLNTNWSNKPSFFVVPFKMSMAFTYNKYIRSFLVQDGVFTTINMLFKNKAFKYFRNKVLSSLHVPITEKIKALYTIVFPTSSGYKILVHINKMIKKT